MKIKNIHISGIGGINDLSLSFNDRFNLICGPNGIGKTTVLECVAHTFSANSTYILKRNVSLDSGSWRAVVNVNDTDIEISISISDFEPNKPSPVNGLHYQAKSLLSLKVNRTFQYQSIDAVHKDAIKEDHHAYEEAKSGVNQHEVKNWFINRYLYSAHAGTLTPEQLHNLELAKRCFSALNENFSFSHVAAASNEIMVNTPNGVIYYEYLSSGFKSCLSILFGIIKEIEFRFKNPTIKADEFRGIVLIDEIELHLHPEWQGRIAKILGMIFPNTQFIASTHSPHVIQSAEPNEIMALATDGATVFRRELVSGAYGFQGWTIEEVLVDVMGMSDTRTSTYHQAIDEFENAIDAEDEPRAEQAYAELDKLLHPMNHLRKLLKLELASIKGAQID